MHSSVEIIDYNSSWRFGGEILFLENSEGSNLTISSEFESPFGITLANELCLASHVDSSLGPEFRVLFEQDFFLLFCITFTIEVENNEVVFVNILSICCITVLVILASGSDITRFTLCSWDLECLSKFDESCLVKSCLMDNVESLLDGFFCLHWLLSWRN